MVSPATASITRFLFRCLQVVSFLACCWRQQCVLLDTCRGQHYGSYHSSVFVYMSAVLQPCGYCMGGGVPLQYQHTHIEKDCALHVRLLAMTAGQPQYLYYFCSTWQRRIFLVPTITADCAAASLSLDITTCCPGSAFGWLCVWRLVYHV